MPEAAVELTIERVLCAVECVPAGRVVNAAGRLPDHLTAEASRYWAEEGTPAVDGRCVMSRARADLLRLAADHETRLAEWGTGSRDLNSLAGQ